MKRWRNGRFAPDTVTPPLLAVQAKNPAAVALGKHGARVTAERHRQKVMRVMMCLRAELELGSVK